MALRNICLWAICFGQFKQVCLELLVLDHSDYFSLFSLACFSGMEIYGRLQMHNNTITKVERAYCVIGDTLRAYANGRKDE